MERVLNSLFNGVTWGVYAAFAFGVAQKVIVCILVFFIGKRLIRWLLKLCDRIFERTKIDLSVAGFLRHAIRIVLYVLLALVLVDYLGFQTSSLVALLASGGVAVGLALQGSLSNVAGGVLLLILKPFRIGDYIIACGNEGTVFGMDIFYTRLKTVDNKVVVIPNGTLSNSNIVNVTNEPKRRLDLTVGIDYSEDIRRVKDVLQRVIDCQESILREEEASIFVSSFDASAITIGVRVWVATEDYWNVKFQLLENIKYAFDEEQITIPFDQLDVNLNTKVETK